MTQPPQGPQWGPIPEQQQIPPMPPRKTWTWTKPKIIGAAIIGLFFLSAGVSGVIDSVKGQTTTVAALSSTTARPAARTSTPAPRTTTTQPAPTTPPTPTVSAESKYVTSHAHDAHVVVVSYQGVQAGIQILSQGVDDPVALASFQQLLSQAKGSFDSARHTFLSSDAPGGLGDANTEAWASIGEFSDAVSSARAYVDSQKPSDLADFGTHWNQGRAWWNEAVTKLWGAANQPPPTV
jgi:hypothetical protein